MKDLLILLCAAVLGVALLLLILRRRSRQNQITALVFLLKESRLLADWQVRLAAAKAFGVELAISNEPGPNTVMPLAAEKVQRSLPADSGTTYLINTGRRRYLLNTFNRPYMEQPEQFAVRIPDLRLRNAVASHRAWISADHFGETPVRAERREVYAALGRLLARFAGEDCLALYCPELERCNEFAPRIVEALQSGNPLAIFDEPTHAPVLDVDGDDPRIRRAVEEARQRWPEFVQAFQQRGNSNHPFIVKARFAQDDEVEFMWVSVQRLAEGNTIVGQLENSPASLTGIKEGDVVTIPLADLNDWVCEINGSMAGGFTLKIIQEMQQRP